MTKKLFSALYKFSTSKKTLLVILMILVIGIAPTRAQTAAGSGITDQGFLGGIGLILDKVIKLFSRVRILLAILAGKLMTNDLVYGTRLHMDQYLWQIRNITKNFANFGLLGFLLRGILKNIWGGSELQKTIVNTLIAGVLIQASWFMVGAIVDISTIATSAVGGIASSFVNTTTTATTIKTSLKKNIIAQDIIINEQGPKIGEGKSNPTDDQIEQMMNFILPKSDSVAGPLIMIGASSLRIQDLITYKEGNAKDLIVNFGLKAMMLILYVATLILLVISNFMRIGFLWVVIATSPLLILLRVFKGGKEGIFGKDDKNFNLSVILSYIFKPVIFMGILSLILIFTATINSLLMDVDNKPIEMNGVTITSNGNNGTMDTAAGSFTLHDAIYVAENESKSALVMTIIYFMTLFMLRALVKAGVKMGGGTIGKTMESMTKSMEDFAKTTPMIPIGGKSYGIGGLEKWFDKTRDNFLKGLDMDKYGNTNRTHNDDMEKYMRSKFLGLNPDRSNLDQEKLIKSTDFFATTKEILSSKNERGETIGREGGLQVGTNKLWRDAFVQWSKSDKGRPTFENIFGRDSRIEDETKLDEFLSKDSKKSASIKNRKLLHAQLANGEAEPVSDVRFLETRYGK